MAVYGCDKCRWFRRGGRKKRRGGGSHNFQTVRQVQRHVTRRFFLLSMIRKCKYNTLLPTVVCSRHPGQQHILFLRRLLRLLLLLLLLLLSLPPLSLWLCISYITPALPLPMQPVCPGTQLQTATVVQQLPAHFSCNPSVKTVKVKVK